MSRELVENKETKEGMKRNTRLNAHATHHNPTHTQAQIHTNADIHTRKSTYTHTDTHTHMYAHALTNSTAVRSRKPGEHFMNSICVPTSGNGP